MGRLIKTNGAEIEVSPAGGGEFTQGEVCRHAGIPDGYIEAMILDNGEVLYYHEEGKLIPLPPNLNATMYAKVHSVRYWFANEQLHGDVLVCAPGETS